jgi:ParB-like chromosome segregation protein Spo0J
MSPAELKELAADIEKNGLSTRIILWPNVDNKLSLIDGRNRLDALALLGLLVVDEKGCLGLKSRPNDHPWEFECAYRDSDPYVLALSYNVHRRHLTAEQKRDLIAKLLEAQPEKSDRQIAFTVKADHKTVSAVRSEKEGRGEIPHVEARTDSKGRKQPAKKSKKKSKRFQATVSAAELADELAAAGIAPVLDRGLDAEASAEKRKASYADEPAGALAKFKAAAAEFLPQLTPAELKSAREYVASDDWAVPDDLTIPGFLLRDLPASNAS